MKYFLYLFFLASFLSVNAQDPEIEKLKKCFLEKDKEGQLKDFQLKYYLTYYKIRGDSSQSLNKSIAKSDFSIKDTLTPFNSILVTPQTLSKPKQELKSNLKFVSFEWARKVTNEEDAKKSEGTVQYVVTNFPNRDYLQVYSAITSVKDESGKNILLTGNDTLTTFNYNGEYVNYGKFYYDNTNKPKSLTISGTVKAVVVSKFLVTTFSAADTHKTKVFGNYKFTLQECKDGKIVLYSNANLSKKDIEVLGVGPSDVIYDKDYSTRLGGRLYVEEYIFNLVKNNPKLLDKKSLEEIYFKEYYNYIKNGPIKQVSVYGDAYKGNIKKVYIVMPSEFITVSEEFTINSVVE